MAFVKGLILASTSKFRKEILSKSGISFECEAPIKDEKTITSSDPEALALDRSVLKASCVSERFPGQLIIGADQTLSFGSELMEKVSRREDALLCLKRLSGKTYTLHSGFCLAFKGDKHSQVQIFSKKIINTKLKLRSLSDEEMEAYLDTNEWQGVVGCTRIEGLGLHLHEPGLDLDIHTIVGLPLQSLLHELRVIGLNGLLNPSPPWDLF